MEVTSLRWNRWLAVLAGIGLLWLNAPLHADESPPTLEARELRERLPELRRGGFVLYLRHCLTRLDQQDQQPFVANDCNTQRNLSDEGRQQASAIGAAFRKLKIPVGRILASPYCRAVDTAQLAFGAPTVTADLHFAVGLGKAERQAKGEALRKLLEEAPPARSNTVIVAHTANLEEAVGYWPKPEGTAFLFRIENGVLRAIGRIPAETWSATSASRTHQN